ncbi:MAG: hypothetical protein R3C97_03555 [Geminicoccaceae bacterium]
MKRFGFFLIAMALATVRAGANDLVDNTLAVDQPVLMVADRIEYAADKESLVAIGDVELSQSGRRLLADRIEYDIAGKKVVARGNIVLLDADGNSVSPRK